MQKTIRSMAVVACMLGFLSSMVVAQDRPGSMSTTPGTPGGAMGTPPGKAPTMSGAPGATGTMSGTTGSMPGKMPAMSGTTGSMSGKAMAVPVNVNAADEAVLAKLKGIGPMKAKALVAYRQQNGPFKSVDDLKKVKGINQKTLDRLKDQIVLQ